MGKLSSIEWTDHTFNPWIGCTKVSEGCVHCYAEALDERRFSKLKAFGEMSHWGRGAPRHVAGDAGWRQPIVWNHAAAKAGKRGRVFCASLADVFDAEAPEGQLERLWGTIRATPNLDWQLLTKRPERIRDGLPADWGAGYANVWLGTSVENQSRADERVPTLLQVPARVHFLSCEPLLGPIDLRGFVGAHVLDEYGQPHYVRETDALTWVIVGGESGPGARYMSPMWVRYLREQCADLGVAFFFKQFGQIRNNPDAKDDTAKENGGSTKGGRRLDGRTHNNMPAIA